MKDDEAACGLPDERVQSEPCTEGRMAVERGGLLIYGAWIPIAKGHFFPFSKTFKKLGFKAEPV